ncbi:MAG: DNA-directed RNA polymerase subunit beta' [Anaerolineae bacterium]|nr:DNA-directed RNA polymerase subunit beta' [Anaerolineae bacterium]
MEVNDFDAIRISLASPEQIRSWSHGEVLKPETINYRTLRPERDGLFCEKIFGPTKDWECYCGKYKRVRYKGIKCDKCGVEVLPSRVRRERMGHIELASPVSHIWYVKGVPSRLGLLLNISPRNLERVLYFAQFIITRVDEEARARMIQRRDRDLNLKLQRMENDLQTKLADYEHRLADALTRLDNEEARRIGDIEDEMARKTNEAMGTGSQIQRQLEGQIGKVAAEAVNLPWLSDALVPVGEPIDRHSLNRLGDSMQQRLTEIKESGDQDKAQIGLQAAARRDRFRHEVSEKSEGQRRDVEREKEKLRVTHDQDAAEIKSIKELDLLTETRYRELQERWSSLFDAAMGAEAIRDVVARIDLNKMAKELRHEIRISKSKQRRKKAAKRLRVAESFRKSGNRPEWMILTVLPVIPPDLRPMVQLDGGRFATSDLNDLYRRVINRNNRLRRLLELGAPDVIVRNEKRMLQEAVDSLIDNGRRGRAVSRSGKRKLKSLSDMLKGKQGRFRRNLLGKRVDYSGRSVIVIGPTLALHQCGLPKKMALELFKPFVMRKLVEANFAHNIKSAKRLVDRLSPEVWDVLEEVSLERPVLLNRAPTLHRLGIQAFEVVLIEGHAIQIHPLVCSAFNADFDGDQMAVHVPLSDEAVREARELMLSSHNLLKPASGEPIVGPSKDMVLGMYWLTGEKPGVKGEGKAFGNMDEVKLAYDLGAVDLRAKIRLRYHDWLRDVSLGNLHLGPKAHAALEAAGVTTAAQVVELMQQASSGQPSPVIGHTEEIRAHLLRLGVAAEAPRMHGLIETTVGRAIFNMELPRELQFVNKVMDKGSVNTVVADCYHRLGVRKTADLVDKIKQLGFIYATRSGMTIAVSDIQVPEIKQQIIQDTTTEVEKAERQYRRGLITEEEQYNRIVELWTRATDDLTQAVKQQLDPLEGLGAMAISGATKGGVTPIRQLAGMRGLMADPSGRIIPLPIRSNFREGLTALEYFLSTHGARKGLADTALRTADAGYLTRRLVDVAQDVIISVDDCGTDAGIWIEASVSRLIGEAFGDRLVGRYAAGAILHPQTGDVIVEKGQMIDEVAVSAVLAAKVQRAYVRSPLICTLTFGLCATCYGRDLARGGIIRQGEAVGIIAAQSIGEPGTQLTLRTFHTGGVAGTEDITQGLPRVEELFEARNPKGEAVIAEIDGSVGIYWEGEQRKLKVTNTKLLSQERDIPRHFRLAVGDSDRVQADTPLAVAVNEQTGEPINITAGLDGHVFIEETDDGWRAVVRREETTVWEKAIPPSARLRVDKGDVVKSGQQLTEGAKNPKEVLRIQGRDTCQLYLVEEVQKVYRSQGVNIHDKHIEVVVRQMIRKVRVRATGDTEFLPGELVDRFKFDEANQRLIERGRTPARGDTVLLGVTKASLNTESFLAAASFQETTRVLTEAAVRGAQDNLRGLKENVIIGKLIPVGTGFEKRRQRVRTEGHDVGREEAALAERGLAAEHGDVEADPD